MLKILLKSCFTQTVYPYLLMGIRVFKESANSKNPNLARILKQIRILLSWEKTCASLKKGKLSLGANHLTNEKWSKIEISLFSWKFLLGYRLKTRRLHPWVTDCLSERVPEWLKGKQPRRGLNANLHYHFIISWAKIRIFGKRLAEKAFQYKPTVLLRYAVFESHTRVFKGIHSSVPS